MKQKNFIFTAFLLLSSLVFPTENRAEGQEQTYKLLDVRKASDESKRLVFAQGHPVVIEDAGEGKVKITTKTGTNDETFTFTEGMVAVYGGAYGKSVESASVTMNSGKLLNLFGGGYGVKDDKTKAVNQSDVTGTTSIVITGGEISNMLNLGGYYYSKSNHIDVKISGGKICALYAGGYDQGKTSNKFDTPLSENVNGVQSIKMDIENATFTEGLGCGGGNGYTYTGTSDIRVRNCSLGGLYGVLSNGHAGDVKASFENCTFKKLDSYFEFAAINRGALGSADFRFDGCSFENLDEINASLGPINGWADSDTDGKIKPSVLGSISFDFVNSKTATPTMQIAAGLQDANVTLKGAKAVVKTFDPGSAVKEDITDFQINEGKVWTFSDGLVVEDEHELKLETGASLVTDGDVEIAGSLTIAENAVMRNNGTVTNHGTITNNGDLVMEVGSSFEGTEPTGNPIEYVSAPVEYHDLHITQSVGAKLVSRHDKGRTPDGGSFTLSLEKESGYEDCNPAVYVKRGRFGEWKELKIDEVSGYYQIRSVYTDIYVKVSGDGIWPVSNEEIEAQEVKVYTTNGKLVVVTPQPTDVQVVSMAGSLVATEKVSGQREFPNLAGGVYIVRAGEEVFKVKVD